MNLNLAEIGHSNFKGEGCPFVGILTFELHTFECLILSKSNARFSIGHLIRVIKWPTSIFGRPNLIEIG